MENIMELSCRSHLLRYSSIMCISCNIFRLFSTYISIRPKHRYLFNICDWNVSLWLNEREKDKKKNPLLLAWFVWLFVCLFDWWIAVKIHNSILSKNIYHIPYLYQYPFRFFLKLRLNFILIFILTIFWCIE